MNGLVRWTLAAGMAAMLAAPAALLAQSESPSAAADPVDDGTPDWIRTRHADSAQELAELAIHQLRRGNGCQRGKCDGNVQSGHVVHNDNGLRPIMHFLPLAIGELDLDAGKGGNA